MEKKDREGAFNSILKARVENQKASLTSWKKLCSADVEQAHGLMVKAAELQC